MAVNMRDYLLLLLPQSLELLFARKFGHPWQVLIQPVVLGPFRYFAFEGVITLFLNGQILLKQFRLTHVLRRRSLTREQKGVRFTTRLYGSSTFRLCPE